MGSVGRVDHCESFFDVLKREQTNREYHFVALKAVKTDLFTYIKRLHKPPMRRRVAQHEMSFSVFKLFVVAEGSFTVGGMNENA